MKKSWKLFMAMLLIGGTALSFTSCSDNENVSNVPTTPEEIALSKETEQAEALLRFLSFSSKLDSLPDNWFSNSYTVEPTVGIVNDASTPHVRYIPVGSKEEAINKYNSFAATSIDKDTQSATSDIEGIGTLKFQVVDQADVTAILDVNIKQQPHLTQIRFVPVSALGSNAHFTGDPYYTFGDVVSLKEGSNISYWICVRPCSNIEGKSTSHWISFQLNDWDSKTKGVNEESVNIAKLSSTGYKDYYMPTKLGDYSEGKEHLLNLFNLLMILDNPNKYTPSAFPNGIGGVKRGELTEELVSTISSYWDKEQLWNVVLPKGVTKSNLETCINQDPEINVFYYGYRKVGGMAVYRSILVQKDGALAYKPKYKDKISWSREKAEGIDFREYSQYGAILNRPNKLISILPDKGFIIRYKTGAQLAGESGNDPEPSQPLKGVTGKYVYKTISKNADTGASLMGDYIENGEDKATSGYNEVCVLNTANNVPSDWGRYSFYLQYQKAGGKVIMQNREISAAAYMQVLNALMMRSDVFKAYQKNKYPAGTLPTFSNAYQTTLKALYDGLNSSVNIDLNGNTIALEDLVNFKALDSRGYEVTSDNAQILATFSITMAYTSQDVEGSYRTAELVYNVKDGTYTITNQSHTTADKNDFFCIKAYLDTKVTQPTLNPGQTFHKEILDDRQSYKTASIDFWNKNKVK